MSKDFIDCKVDGINVSDWSIYLEYKNLKNIYQR